MIFQELVEKVLEEGQLKQAINQLLVRKMRGDELDLEPRINEINQFIEAELARMELVANALPVSKADDLTPRLDQLFRDMLQEVWHKK